MMRLGIPVIELKQDNPKGIFFLIHGHFGNKSLHQFGGLAERIHQLGFFVVSIDAYKHGERLAEPYITQDAVNTTYEMVSVIDQTIQDIMFLYTNHYSKIAQNVSVMGISMGGHISFLLNQFLRLEFCIPIIGSPNLLRHYQTKKSDILKEKLTELEKKLVKLTLKPYDFKPKYAFVLEGEKDTVVSYLPAKALIESLGNDAYVYKGYPVGHELSEMMKEDIITFVRSRL